MKNWITCCLIVFASAQVLANETLRMPTADESAAAEQRHRDEAAKRKVDLQRVMASVEADERRVDAARAAAKKECGADFGVPRVGMTLARAKTCLGYARLVGQVNRKDGVASVYTNGRVQLIVMDEKVVAWQATR